MVFRDQNKFGDSHYLFNLARTEVVDYNDENFQETIKGLHDVLVLPSSEKYEEKHIEFLASSITKKYKAEYLVSETDYYP